MNKPAQSASAFWQAVRANHTLQRQALPIQFAPRDGRPLPLATGQERLWFVDQLHSQSTAHNLRAIMRLQGPLHVAALEQSVQAIVHRHEILRTHFVAIDGKPMGIINPSLKLPLPVVDLSTRTPAEQEHEVQQRARAAAQAPFDLGQVPLLRMVLLRMADDDHILLRTTHHSITDRWSDSVFLHELATLYRAAIEASPAGLADLPFQYADFAWSQRTWLQGDAWQTKVTYWQQQLAGPLSPIILPTDSTPAAETSYQGYTRYLTLAPALTEALKALSHREGVSLFATLLATFKTVLYRYTDQTDMVICCPIAGRSRVDVRKLIGYFTNLVLIRTTMQGGLPFRELLHQVGSTVATALEHQDLPLQHLVDTLQIPSTILSRVLFTLQNVPPMPTHMADIQLTPIDMEEGISNFDLSLSVKELDGQLIAVLRAKTSLFREATMMTLLERYQLFLEQLVATPDLPIDQLPHYQLSSAQPLAGAASRPPYVAPTSELEQTIARIWQRVLQIDQIGIHDNFFDLGGRSLAMMQVCSELAATIPGIHVVDLSRQFTISDMACYLNQSRQPESMDRQALDAITRRQKEAMKRRQERARQRSKG